MCGCRVEAALLVLLLAPRLAGGLQLDREPVGPQEIALAIADLTSSPEDEFDIPYEISLFRGELMGEDPASELIAAGEQKEQSAQCVPEARAGVAAGFLETFNAKFKPRFADAFKTVKDPAYLTVGDWRFKEMLRNFMVHAHNLTCATNDKVLAVHVGLDKGSFDECLALAKGIVQPSNVGSKGKFELRCIDLSGWLPAALFEEKAAQSWSCAYNMLLWTKPHIIVAAVEAASAPVMMIDTDVILHKNVLQLAPKVLSACDGCTVISGREHSSQHKQNTGTVYSHKAGLPLLKEWAKVDSDFLNAKEGDQSAMQSLMATNRRLEKQLAVFNLEEVGECGIPGSYATHYNCLTGKKVNMVRQGDWDTRVYREPTQLRCREPGEPVEVLQNTGATHGDKNLLMPTRKRTIGGASQANGVQQLKFKGATSCDTMVCNGSPAKQAIDGFVNTVAGVNQLNMWTGDLGELRQVARVEVTFESCLCKEKNSMLLEASKDGSTWTGYGAVSELTVWEGTQTVAFERLLNARYIRLRPASSYTSRPRRNDKWFSVREVEAFGRAHPGEEQPEASLPLTRAERRRQRRERTRESRERASRERRELRERHAAERHAR